MRKIKDIEIAGRRITVSELTVEEVINQLDSLVGSLVAIMFDGRLPIEIVAQSSGLDKTEFDKWFPTDIDKLITEVETVNPHCARLCQTMARIRAEKAAKVSGAPVSNSPSTASVRAPGGSGFPFFWRFGKHGRK